VRAENSHPFENLTFEMDKTFGLYSANWQVLERMTLFGQDNLENPERPCYSGTVYKRFNSPG
jgi:hypothetical protein